MRRIHLLVFLLLSALPGSAIGYNTEANDWEAKMLKAEQARQRREAEARAAADHAATQQRNAELAAKLEAHRKKIETGVVGMATEQSMLRAIKRDLASVSPTKDSNELLYADEIIKEAKAAKRDDVLPLAMAAKTTGEAARELFIDGAKYVCQYDPTIHDRLEAAARSKNIREVFDQKINEAAAKGIEDIFKVAGTTLVGAATERGEVKKTVVIVVAFKPVIEAVILPICRGIMLAEVEKQANELKAREAARQAKDIRQRVEKDMDYWIEHPRESERRTRELEAEIKHSKIA